MKKIKAKTIEMRIDQCGGPLEWYKDLNDFKLLFPYGMYPSTASLSQAASLGINLTMLIELFMPEEARTLYELGMRIMAESVGEELEPLYMAAFERGDIATFGSVTEGFSAVLDKMSARLAVQILVKWRTEFDKY